MLVITVGVVVDSTLCLALGGRSRAQATVQSVIADASKFYEIPTICAKLRVGKLSIFCNAGNDLIAPILGPGTLQFVRRF